MKRVSEEVIELFSEEMMDSVEGGASIVRETIHLENGVVIERKADRARGGFVRIESTIQNYEEILSAGREKRIRAKQQGE